MKPKNYDGIRFKRLKERVSIIKKQIRDREKQGTHGLYSNPEHSNSKTTLRFLPNNEITYKSIFARNPFDEKKYMQSFNFKKHKLSLEMADRNMHKNRIEHVLKQVALHSVKAKSRLHIHDIDMVAELKDKINKNTKRCIMSTKSLRKQPISLSKNPYNETSHINEEDNCKEDDLDYNDETGSYIKIKDIRPLTSTNIETQQYHQRIMSGMPFRGNSLTTYSMSATTKGKGRQTSNFFHTVKKSKVINKPIYTTSIHEFVKDYKRLQKQLHHEKHKFVCYGLLSQEEIDMLMNARSEMKMLNLRHKFVSTMFKPKNSQPTVLEQKEKFLYNINKQVDQIDTNYLAGLDL